MAKNHPRLVRTSAEPTKESLAVLLEFEAHRLSEEVGVDEDVALHEVKAIVTNQFQDARVRRFIPLLAHRRAKERLTKAANRRNSNVPRVSDR